MITLAKAITDGVGGLGAMIATDKVARSMQKDGAFYSTYGWHPRSTEVAIATLEYLVSNEARLLANVEEMSAYFRLRLEAMPSKRDPTVRIEGLAIGIDFGDEKYADKVGERCRAKGLLVSPEGETVLLIPSLDIDRKTAAKGLDILADCV
jgi:acetylornithine/succinyldiaminopimelate/putrescine aminotransferase